MKIVTLGNTAVGKTSLLDRWVNGTYRSGQAQTTHVGFLPKRLEIDGELHIFQFWDTAGQEKFMAITGPYCRNAKGALIVFDKTDRVSFEEIPKWINLLHGAGNPHDLPIVIAANKADLEGEVSIEEISAFCNDNRKISFFETSALNGMNVDAACEELCRAVVAKSQATSVIDMIPPSVDLKPAEAPAEGGSPAPQGGGCC
jgi:small GTP-binding protein